MNKQEFSLNKIENNQEKYSSYKKRGKIINIFFIFLRIL